MAKLALIEVARQERLLTLDQKWQRYLDLREQAERSRDINVAISAGRAWADWGRQLDVEANTVSRKGARSA